MGRPKPSDFVFTTLGTLYLVSPRVLSLFAEIKASGWRQYPVSLRDKLDAVVAGYAGLAVTGRCGPALSSRSMRVEMTMPGGVFPIWKGMYFDEASWDGSDVFTFPGTAMVVVVERVRRPRTRKSQKPRIRVIGRNRAQ